MAAKTQLDIVFLKNEVQRLKELISNSAQEKLHKGEAGLPTFQWRDPIPYMRLMRLLD
jgi:hypothetical protein